MQYIIAITQCTNRKTSTERCVSKSDILQGMSLNSTADQWANEIKLTEPSKQVIELYCGRGFSEFKKACESLGEPESFVISAGLGLVNGNDFVPNYNLTIAPGTENSILKGAEFSALEWWQAINERRNSTTTPISDLITENNIGLVLIGVSKPYLSFISAELEALTDQNLANVRLIGPVNNDGIPDKLKQILMPYNHNFDGPDSPNHGTKADYCQRVFRHFTEVILTQSPLGTLKQHQDLVAHHMDSMRPAKLQFDRIKLTDDEVVAKIKEFWDICNGASGATLRYFRDQGFACEQSRFAKIFREVKHERLQHD